MLARLLAIWLALTLMGLALAGAAWAEDDMPCLQCHLAGPRQTLGQVNWLGPDGGLELGGCPALATLRGRLAATQALLLAQDQRLADWSRRGFYTAPWRQGLDLAQDQWRRVLQEPLESLGEATARLAGVAATVETRVSAPQRQAELAGQHRLWLGWLLLGGLLLTLAWLVGLRRGLPQDPEQEAFAQVKAGRLP